MRVAGLEGVGVGERVGAAEEAGMRERVGAAEEERGVLVASPRAATGSFRRERRAMTVSHRLRATRIASSRLAETASSTRLLAKLVTTATI